MSSVHYFEATDCIDNEIREMLNNKLKKIKEFFEQWQQKQLQVIKKLNKKLYLYENMSKEYHGLINIPVNEIFHGLSLMGETAEEMWTHITDAFGDRYFFSIIEKLYAPYFVEDTKLHHQQIMKAVS